MSEEPASRIESRPPITRINLKLLQTFMLVAETGSFKEASVQAHRSQSAVSMQIKQLEQQLGLVLFHRTTRDVRLTQEGEQLLLSTRRGLHEVAFGLRQIYEAAEIRGGRVLLGCSPSIAATYLPAILAAFETEYPGVKVLLSEQRGVDLAQSLAEDKLDFCVGPRVETADLEFESIITDQLCAVVPQAMAGDHRGTITLAALAELPLLHFQPASAMAKLTEDAARLRNIRLNIRFRCIQAQTLVALAEAGLGAAVLRQSLAEAATSPALRRLLIVEPVLTEEFGLMRMRGRSLSPAASRLAQLVRERMRNLAAERHNAAHLNNP